jgi:hypothetical protein
MKSNIFMLTIVALCLWMGAAARCETNSPVRKPASDYPATGMSVAELEKTIAEIKTLMPVGKDMNILSIWIHDPDTINIRTGQQNAPLAGGGKTFEFRKIKGKWTKTSEGLWVS